MKPVVVLFPCGTANALGWSLRIAGSPIERMMRGKARALPSFEVRFLKGTNLLTDEGRREVPLAGIDGQNDDEEEATEYAAVVVSWGLHASLVAMSDSAEYRKMGVERFRVVAEKLLKKTRRYRGRVTVRREKDERFEWAPLQYPGEDLTSNLSDLTVSEQAPREQTTKGTSTSSAAADDHSSNQPSTNKSEPQLINSSAPTSIPPWETHAHSYILLTPISNLEQNFVISPAASLSLSSSSSSYSSPTPGPTLSLPSNQLPSNLHLVALPAPLSSEKIIKVLGAAYKDGAHVRQTDTVVYQAVEGIRVELLPPDSGRDRGQDNDKSQDQETTQQQEQQNNDGDKEDDKEEWSGTTKMHRMVCVDGRVILVPEGGWFEVRRMERRCVVEVVC